MSIIIGQEEELLIVRQDDSEERESERRQLTDLENVKLDQPSAISVRKRPKKPTKITRKKPKMNKKPMKSVKQNRRKRITLKKLSTERQLTKNVNNSTSSPCNTGGIGISLNSGEHNLTPDMFPIIDIKIKEETQSICSDIDVNNISIYQQDIKKEVLAAQSVPVVNLSKMVVFRYNYVCYICFMVFPSSIEMEKHLAFHLELYEDMSCDVKPTLQCEVCPFRCRFSATMTIHGMLHLGQKVYKCRLCPFVCKRYYNLKCHRLTHGGESTLLFCDVCPYKCSTKSYMQEHILKHDRSKIKYLCEICSFGAARLSTLVHHRKAHTEERPFDCQKCDKKYKCFRDLKEHVRVVHGFLRTHTCDMCSYTTTSSGRLKRHQLIHSGIKQFECTVCSHKFNQKAALKQHIMVHTDEKPLQCGVCDYTCRRPSEMKCHNRTHTGETPYRCHICTGQFKHLSSLKKHVRDHLGEGLQCHVCDFVGAFSAELRRHMLTHKNAGNFTCGVCDASFKHMSSMYRHRKTHEEKFKCELCPRQYTRLDNLKCHMRSSHRDKMPPSPDPLSESVPDDKAAVKSFFKCADCNFKTKYSEALEIHGLAHAGVTVFKCDVCLYQFKNASSLLKHKLKKTDEKKALQNLGSEKTFHCDMCTFRCKYSSSFHRHRRKHSIAAALPS